MSSKRELTISDNRPFFEKALKYGVEHSIISTEKLDAILKDGPKGIEQIATVFGNPHRRPDLEAARNRMVNLVSLYLENASEGDLRKAAQSLANNTFLSHSKGGSDMIKSVNAMLGVTSDLTDLYDKLAPSSDIKSDLLPQYSREKNTAENAIAFEKTGKWALQTFSTINPMDVKNEPKETLIVTLLLFVIADKPLESVPTKKQLIDAFEKCKWKEISWGKVTSKIPAMYFPTMRKCMLDLETRLGLPLEEPLQASWIIEPDGHLDEISDYDNSVYEKWEELTNGKRLKPEEKQTLLFCVLGWMEPKKYLTRAEAKEILASLTELRPSQEGAIGEFMKTSVPFSEQESMLRNWNELMREYETLADPLVTDVTKMYILMDKSVPVNIVTVTEKKKLDKSTKPA